MEQLLSLVGLNSLMNKSQGREEIKIGLIDGPVLTDQTALKDRNIHFLSRSATICSDPSDLGCVHGTLVAGMLVAERNSGALALCPDCTLIVRPIFLKNSNGIPSSTPNELATAIIECVEAGVRIINMSVAIQRPSNKEERYLAAALNFAMNAGVIIVAAAGNQATLGTTTITRHPGVIPVSACDQRGVPLAMSNLSIPGGRHGLTAPGSNIKSLATNGNLIPFAGTSAAVPFVTGAISLVWSLLPEISINAIRQAFLVDSVSSRRTVSAPLLNASAAFSSLLQKSHSA